MLTTRLSIMIFVSASSGIIKTSQTFVSSSTLYLPLCPCSEQLHTDTDQQDAVETILFQVSKEMIVLWADCSGGGSAVKPIIIKYVARWPAHDW